MPPTQLESLWAAIPFGRLDPRSDGELLTRFLDDHDPAAFETLLTRHGPAVRAVCRGWLRSAADVDDAAQATFLVLVQRGGSIRDRSALGLWLSRVATNVARRQFLDQRPGHDHPPGRPVSRARPVLDRVVLRAARRTNHLHPPGGSRPARYWLPARGRDVPWSAIPDALPEGDSPCPPRR